ncbi:MAG: hypothetical protein KBT02_05515 [Treponema sp.]|nr:hypothetical protein [Candidatus Treponema caballi]
MNVEELEKKILSFSTTYFFSDVHKDRDEYYSLPLKDFASNPICMVGYILNLFIDGELDKANAILATLPEDNIFRIGLTLANPTVTWKEFIHIINQLKRNNRPINNVVLTAGRPYLLNGFNDFTRIGPLLAHHKDLFIEDVSFLYGTECTSSLYNLCLAEYYYQQNRVMDSELLVSRTIKEFDKKDEFRFLFAALFLEAKNALAMGTIVKPAEYIADIKRRVTEVGKAEFSMNINACEVHLSLYSGNYDIITSWLAGEAPDEAGDFNMLDLYRYMIKIRCYIVQEELSAAVALIEKLRPLLERGKRHIDLCELDLLLAETLYAAGKTEEAFEPLARALKGARRRKYYRLVADEGAALFELLLAYAERTPDEPGLPRFTENTRRMAIMYPLYLKPRYKNNQQFSQMEVEMLNLLQQGKTLENIGTYFFISVNTVKYHLKKIYTKLNAANSNQAVWNARLLGLIK